MNNIKILIASGVTIGLVIGAGYLTKRRLAESQTQKEETLEDRE